MVDKMRRRRSADSMVDGSNTQQASSWVVRSASNMTSDDEFPESDTATTILRQKKKKFIARLYFVHLVLVAGVLLLGMMHNVGNKKYIPVNAKELLRLMHILNSTDTDNDFQQCKKAYVNVHSASVNEEFAAVCCYDDENDRTMHSICHPKLPIIGLPTRHLPFSKRLTRFPEAWILPLLPILIRLAYQGVCALFVCYNRYCNHHQRPISVQREATSISYSVSSSITSSSTSLEKIVIDNSLPSEEEKLITESNHTSIATTVKRLFFYVALLLFRGYGLYIGANALEDYVLLPLLTGNTVTSPLRRNSLSDTEHDVHYRQGDESHCWYEDALKAHHKISMESHSECYGQPFDFSDHVVLFLAHYLPIFFMEMLICVRYPFWERASGFWYAIHASLFVYLHLLVLYATYQTAVYYHTRGEIIVGYVVSLLVQLPLYFLTCSEKWLRLNRFIGIQEGSIVVEKSD